MAQFWEDYYFLFALTAFTNATKPLRNLPLIIISNASNISWVTVPSPIISMDRSGASRIADSINRAVGVSSPNSGNSQRAKALVKTLCPFVSFVVRMSLFFVGSKMLNSTLSSTKVLRTVKEKARLYQFHLSYS